MKTPLLVCYATCCALALYSASSQAQSWEHLNCGEDWTPSKSSAPVYPKRALDRGLEGSIEMSFSINPQGKVEDIGVIQSSRKVFIRAATRAVSAMEFPPCMQDGVATKLTNVSIKYDFNLK